ncbi:MAG: hypothetical protein IT338_02960 [Thermomicrobiales bacterium]|nr:hypothetical protein [Thermomicrobiales bacterium]
MDGKQFDRIARDLTRETSRRTALGGLLGGTLALVMGGNSVSAIRRRKRRGRKGRDGVETTESALPPGTLSGGVWDETLQICHFDPESGKVKVIAVSTPSVPQYLNAGDTLFIDCCVDEECGALPCLTPTGCIQGACAYDTTEGAACALEDGTTGYCSSDATCVASYIPSDTSGYAAEETTGAAEGDTGYIADDTGGYPAGDAGGYTEEAAPESTADDASAYTEGDSGEYSGEDFGVYTEGNASGYAEDAGTGYAEGDPGTYTGETG